MCMFIDNTLAVYVVQECDVFFRDVVSKVSKRVAHSMAVYILSSSATFDHICTYNLLEAQYMAS